MIQIKKIDHVVLFPNIEKPGYNICSIYFRDEKNHKWLLYGERVDKNISISETTEEPLYYTSITPPTRFELNLEMKGRTEDSRLLTLIDLEPNPALPELYEKLVSLVREYKGLIH
jgi:hypothetical protein